MWGQFLLRPSQGQLWQLSVLKLHIKNWPHIHYWVTKTKTIVEREFQILVLMNFHEPLEIKCNFQWPSSSDSPLHFQFNMRNNALARCPHCRKVSSVGGDFRYEQVLWIQNLDDRKKREQFLLLLNHEILIILPKYCLIRIFHQSSDNFNFPVNFMQF